ncbi:MAG: DNA methyltransferase [Planctomycetota bacterium]
MGDPRKDEPRGPRNGPKVQPRTPRGTTFRKPTLEPATTTLWSYPSQHYTGRDGKLQGDPNYTGATPSWVIWQLLTRYTEPGEVVVDPMCGSGTTLDVCRDLDRDGIGFDIAPSRRDIRRADARTLPLDDASAAFVFVDPPYSTHVEYSNDPACIGQLDAGGPDGGHEYYDAMGRAIGEMHRVLKPGRFAGLYVSDSWRKTGDDRRTGRALGEFMPIGFRLLDIMLRTGFEAVDVVAVVRRNEKLKRGKWHDSAAREGFMLRGFNYLFIVRKPRRRR